MPVHGSDAAISRSDPETRRAGQPGWAWLLARQAALCVPAIRRLLQARDNALRERDDAVRERDEILHQRDNALSERNDALRRRDDALRERDACLAENNLEQQDPETILRRMRDRVATWHGALTAAQNAADWVPACFLPPGPSIARAPQRYTDNDRLYLERGGLMRPAEDIAGYLRDNPQSIFDQTRFYFLSLVIDQVARDNLPGDLAELGVDKGNTAAVLARAAARLGRRVYLLDTFEGFPEQDLIGDEARHRGGYTDTSLALVQTHISGEHVRFVKGYFPDTASQIPDDASFCVVHLDCDLYKPFAAALAYFWPRIVPGGFLIMHDYTTLYWDGVERAVDEFFATRPEAIIPIPDMAGTVAARKSREPDTKGG